MSLTNVLLIAIAIGISMLLAKLENVVKLLSQVSTDIRHSADRPLGDSKPLGWHLDRLHGQLDEAWALLSRIESHTGYLTEPVKEARMKEIVDAVPRRS